MNVYQMYHKNDCQFGFFICRDSWTTIVARVTGIKGVKQGEKIKGRHPYYGNPRVTAEFYSINPKSLKNKGSVSCAGTYGYRMLSEKEIISLELNKGLNYEIEI